MTSDGFLSLRRQGGGGGRGQTDQWRGQVGRGRGQAGQGRGQTDQGGARPIEADRRQSGTDKVRARKVLAGLLVRVWSEQD